MQNSYINLNIWSSSHSDHQDYGKLTKVEKKVFRELCSTRGDAFIDRVLQKKALKEIAFLTQLISFYRLNVYRNRARFILPCPDFRAQPEKMISTMIGLPNKMLNSDGCPNWTVSRGKRQSHSYRLNRLCESLDRLYDKLVTGQFNVPLVWSITSDLLPESSDPRSNSHHSRTNIKMIGKNRSEVEQIWETMIRIPLGLKSISHSGRCGLVGPLRYFNASNSTEITTMINLVEEDIMQAARKKERLEKNLKVLQQNFAVVNSTIVMANSTYGQ